MHALKYAKCLPLASCQYRSIRLLLLLLLPSGYGYSPDLPQTHLTPPFANVVAGTLCTAHRLLGVYLLAVWVNI